VRVNVHFDVSTRNLHFWDPWSEAFEALPVVDSVTDRDGDRRFGGGARELHLKPSLQRGNRAACFRPGAPTDAPRRSCRGSALRSCKAQRSAAAPPRRSAPTRPWRSRRSARASGPSRNPESRRCRHGRGRRPACRRHSRRTARCRGSRGGQKQKPADQQPTGTGIDVLRPDRKRANELPITLKNFGR